MFNRDVRCSVVGMNRVPYQRLQCNMHMQGRVYVCVCELSWKVTKHYKFDVVDMAMS